MAQSAIASIVLAAGGSTRFGKPKQLLTWEGRPLVAHVTDTAWMAGLGPVCVVVGAAAEDVIPVLASRPVQIVRNYRWEDGLSSSLSAGLAALPPSTEAVIFMPVDQPLITPGLIQKLVAHWEATRAGIVVPRTPEGQRGLPVLFSKPYFTDLATLSGDVGGRALFDRYATDIAYLPIPNARVLFDVDTPKAYAQLQADVQTGDPELDLGAIRGVICDMDGVLWRGSLALPGLKRFFALLEDLDLAHVMVTNNSSRTSQAYVHKLGAMGVATTTDHVLNSAVATARYVSDAHPGATVYPIGGPGVLAALKDHGLVVRGDDAIEHADVVVVGWDQKLTWQKLATATRLILNGAVFVGTNPDLTFPMETGLAPGNGAQLAALEAATQVAPEVIGKPSPPLYQQALERMGTTPDTTLVIGDRLDTDILGGIRLGMPTALVLTGISQRVELGQAPIRPTAVFEDLPALIAAWRAARVSS